MYSRNSSVIILHDAKPLFEQKRRTPLLGLLALRMMTFGVLVVLLALHIRSMRMFRWEQMVSGGLVVTYCVAMLGLVLCTGTDKCGGTLLQPYFCGVGALLFTVNASVLWRRWRTAGELTRVVAELLATLGVRLERQVICKIWLSMGAALALMVDMAVTPFLPPKTPF